MGSMSFVCEDIAVHTDINATVLEIHQLAYFYHWGREECWNTPCSQRGVFIDQIKQQIKLENGKSPSSPNKPKYKENQQ